MELKKSINANLEKKRIPLIIIGILFSTALVLVAFEWKTYETEIASLGQLDIDLIEEEIIPISQQQPPPPPPPPAPTTVIEIVEDEKEIEEELVIEDMEVDEDTEIEFIEEATEEVAEEQIFTIVEEMPSFPGGEPAMMKYLANNIKYPAIAKDANIQGTVYVTFVVNEKGEVKDVKVLRSIGGGTDEEAIRVVQSMPKWKPGKQRGKAVKVQYNLPIRFTLR
ncbi:energy transducer TonB [Cryomorpha ignava]|uniref:Energy transducer TonB n=1 Tax=Cryomorpha ignava TaxID=101383 RepID=A0A7K3WTX9_9FLAO|nr:energy transducer TonB [Cryomorpha ignava]NEN25143.1 energy transducer TonB [Cryomorpha ignava]